MRDPEQANESLIGAHDFGAMDDVPRSIPVLARPALYTGGALAQFGWLFFGFGMIFARVFGGSADLTSWWTFAGSLETRSGKVTQVEKTNFSVGGSDNSPGTPVYRIAYRFVDDAQKPHTGVSYKTGSPPSGHATVKIEHPQGDPQTSRIKGLRSKPLGPWAIFVMVFPAIGFAFMLWGFRRGRLASRLLRNGRLAMGSLISKDATGTKVNNKTVYKYTFEFSDETGQRHTAVAKTHNTEILEDDEHEKLIYDPIRPHEAVLLDSLPGGVSLGDDGRVTARLGACVASLVLPGLTIGGHALGYLWF